MSFLRRNVLVHGMKNAAHKATLQFEIQDMYDIGLPEQRNAQEVTTRYYSRSFSFPFSVFSIALCAQFATHVYGKTEIRKMHLTC
jgi:hypothetical protein